MGVLRNLIEGVVLLGVVVASGTVLIMYFEGLSPFDSLYYIIFTVTTVGATYNAQTLPGKVSTIFSIVFGMGVAIYIATLLARVAIESETIKAIRGLTGGRRKMKKMSDHIIVCGYSQLGKHTCKAFKESKEKYLIIEKNKDTVAFLLQHGEPVYQGDCLEPMTLHHAHIKEARALVGALADDAENLYLMMTATDLNPNLLLAARAKSEEAVERLHKIGARIVVMPQIVGGKQLADAVMAVQKRKTPTELLKKSLQRKR